MSRRLLLTLTTFFLLVSLALMLLRQWLVDLSVEVNVALAGNLILFLATMASAYIYNKAMKKQKPHAFVGQVYSGFILKLLVLLTAALAYFYLAKEINKPAVIICLILYLIYHFLATGQVVAQHKTR